MREKKKVSAPRAAKRLGGSKLHRPAAQVTDSLAPELRGSREEYRLTTRTARLAMFSPQLADAQSIEFANALRTRWSAESVGGLLNTLREAASPDVLTSMEQSGEEPSFGFEGQTTIVNYPLYQVHGAQVSLEARACIALCTRGLSSKAWMIFRYVAPEHIGPGRDRVALHHGYSLLSRLGTNGASWLYEWMQNCLEKDLGGRLNSAPVRMAPKSTHPVHIATVGVKDPRVNDLMFRLSVGEQRFLDVICAPEAKPLLHAYFQQLVPGQAEAMCSDKSAQDWYEAPIKLRRSDGLIEHRHAIYHVRHRTEDGSVPQEAVGLCFDGNGGERLSSASSLQMARWIGQKY